MRRDPSLGSRASSLARWIIQTETLQMFCRKRSVAGSGMGRGVAGWTTEVGSGRSTWELAIPGCVPPSWLLGASFSPKSLLSLIVHQQQGSVCLLAPSPALPASPSHSHHVSPTTWKVVGIYSCCLVLSLTLFWCHVLISI